MSNLFKHLLLVSIDDLRFDALGCEPDKSYLRRYSLESAPRTPHIDRFAREGVRFSGCRSTAPFTPPSHGSMITGMYPFRHGVRPFMRNQLDGSARTLFERLQGAGFTTLASCDFDDIFKLTGIARGAQYLPSRDDGAAIGAFEAAAKAGKQVFLFCHVGDVHPPYGETFYPQDPKDNAPFIEGYLDLARRIGLKVTDAEARKAQTDRSALIQLSNRVRLWADERDKAAAISFPRYLAGINRYDSLRFARFFAKLESLGLLDETLVVLTSDHGQAVLEPDQMASEPGKPAHRKFDHGECIAEQVIRVPLIFWSKAPGFRGGAWDLPVSSTDIAPTVLGALGVPFGAAEMDGVNRRALLFEQFGTGTEWQKAQAPSDCYAEAWYHDRAALSAYLRQCIAAGRMVDPPYETRLHQQAVRAGRYKLIQTAGSEPALFDTVNDPWEKTNLLDYHPFYGRLDFIPNYDKIAHPLLARMKALTDGRTVSTVTVTQAGPASQPGGDVTSLESRLRELGYIE